MSERESMAVAVLPDATLRAVMAGLLGLQSHAGGLRSVSYGATGSGGLRETTADERAIDAGAVTRGRVAWARLAHVPLPQRAALEWLRDRAHAAADARVMARLYAEQHGPVAMREAAARAPVEADRARTAHTRARRVLSAATTPETIALHATARDRAEATAARAREAEAALLAWGTRALADACVAWLDAGRERGEDAA